MKFEVYFWLVTRLTKGNFRGKGNVVSKLVIKKIISLTSSQGLLPKELSRVVNENWLLLT